MKKYELIKVIGDGTYGVVYEAINKETNQRVAVKRLKERFRSMEECLSRIEVKVLEKLNHENIVQLKEVIRDKKGEVSYIFEYCDCNLFEFTESHRENQKLIPEPIIREIVYQITKGMKYMHSKQYFHRDLKPENILLILNNYSFNNMVPGELRVKIADFGTAKEIPIKNILPMTDYVCTRWYRPPECILKADNYNEKMDVWAIGCVMAELYNLGAIFPGENEFDQLNQILKILGTPTRSKWPWGYFQSELFGIQLPIYYKKDFKKILGYICQDGVDLLNDIFTFDPAKRPSCSKILNHPFFKTNSKPKITIISNNIRTSNRKATYGFNKDDKNNPYYNLYKKNNIYNRTNNNSINKTYTDNIAVSNINKNNISKNNNNPIKTKITLKASNTNSDFDDYKANSNLVSKKTIDINNINNIKIENNRTQNKKGQNINNISTTDRKIRNNNSKYVKITEIKSETEKKKNINYNKNNEESKMNDNKNSDRNELIVKRIERIGRNETKFNYPKKLSFIDNTKIDEKDENRNMSIDDKFLNKRNTISSTKYKYVKNVGQKNNPINDIKNINNYKMVDITNDNKNNNNLTNHKEHYINYKAERNNISKSIAKSFYLRRNEKNTERNTEKNTERNTERNSDRNSDRNSGKNNNKRYLGTKNLNNQKDKKKERKNHNFYESKDNKKNKLNNHKFNININNYNTYKENNINTDNKNNHNHNNIYISSVGRNYSAKKKIVYDQEYRHTTKNSNNLKKIDYRHNITPKNRRHSTYNIKHKKISKSPIRDTDKILLFSSFISSKNNDNNNNIFDTSQSLLNNSTININQQNNSIKRSNNNKRRIKLVNAKVLDDINYSYNIIKNYIPSSTAKKDNYRNTKN